MRIGFFTREGRHLVGRIGDLILAWDRHEGGRLRVSHLVDGRPVSVGDFAIQAELEGGVLHSACDPDPRLIPVEAGPHRLVLRAAQRLYDDDGVHLGDAMQETWAWADGSLYLNAMVRLIHSGRGGRLIGAEAGLAFAEGWTSAEGEDIRLVHESGRHLAVIRYAKDCPWAVPFGEEDPWGSLGEEPPFYRRWGPYYDQWGGDAGWSSLRLEEGPVLRGIWADGELRERGSVEGFRGCLALLYAGDGEELERKVRAFARPLCPSVEGGKLLYHSPMEGVIAIRKTGERLKVRFPADPESREARLQITGTGGRRGLRVAGAEIGFPMTDGGVTDDPNGPDLLRPDDRHGLILTDGDVRPDEWLATVSLAADRETEVELASAPGLQLVCRKWDDRQELLLFSSAHPQGNLGSFSLRDLKMRNLGIPGYVDPVMARLPLYWFQANAHSAHHCLNQPEEVELIENGPDAIRFRVAARNPAGTALSEMDVQIPFLEDRLRIDMVCRFTALEEWDLAEVQYCNFFPEETRMPGDWNSDRVLVMASDGQRTRIDHRAAGDSRVLSGADFRYYEGDLFVALYGGPKGNIFALSRPREIGGARPGYQLCGCWLDNHLFLSGGEGMIPAGMHYEVELSLVMARTTGTDEDVEAIGRRALDSGEIVL
jgi:hypothetical protein